MKRLLGVMVALIAVGLVLLPVNSQAADFGKKGQIEVGGDISFTSTTPVYGGTTQNATSDFMIEPYAGYFIIDGFELGLRPIVDITSPPSPAKSVTTLNIFLAPAYNFKLQNSPVTPFVEGLIGFSSYNGFTDANGAQTSGTGISFGGHAGVKVLVTGNGLLNVGVEYVAITTKPSGASDRVGENLLGVNVGFTLFFN